MKYILITFSILIFGGQLLLAQAPELRIPAAAHECNDFAFSKDDQLLVTTGANEVKVWDMSGPYLLKNLRWPGMDTLYNVQIMFAPDLQKVVIFAEGYIRTLNLRTLEWVGSTLKCTNGSNMALSIDGNSVYMQVADFNVHQYQMEKLDLTTGKSTVLAKYSLTPKDGGDDIDATEKMDLSPDGNYLIVQGYVNGGFIFDLKTNKIIKTFSPQRPIFLTKAGIVTSTPLTSGDNTNPTYLIEELEWGTWKILRKKEFTFKNDDIPNANGIVWVSHDHKNKILYESEQHFYVFDAKTWTLSARQKYQKGKQFGSTHFTQISDGGKYLCSSSTMEVFSLENGDLAHKIGFFPFQPFNLAQANISTNRGILAGYKHLHFDPKGFRLDILPVLEGCDEYNYIQRSIYRVLPEHKKLVMTNGNGMNNYQLYTYTLGTDTSLVNKVMDTEGSPISCIELKYYADNNTVLAVDFDRITVLDAKTLKQKSEIMIYDSDLELRALHYNRRDESFIIDRSPDKTKIVVNMYAEVDGKTTARIVCFDLAKGQKVWYYEEKELLSNPLYTADGKQVWTISTATNTLVKLDAATGKVISKSNKIPYANSESQLSQSGKYILNFINVDPNLLGATQINVVDVATNDLKFALRQQRMPYLSALFFDNERFLITQDEDLKVWDMASGKMLARIILVEDGKDWIVATPDGRFDGSEGGMKQMYYVQGREFIPLEQLYEGFYTPNLLYEVMYGDGKAKSAAPPVEFNRLKMPPSVRIVNKSNTGLRNLEVVETNVPNYESAQKTATLSVEADGKDDKITEIRLYQNGKLITDGTRGFKPVVEGMSKSERNFEVTLLPGENRFRAVAVNSQRTESRAEEITIQFKAAPDAKKEVGITLHMVVIGVNQYKNAKYNLNYAEADAKALRDQLKTNCGRVVSDCKEYYILNDQAVKSSITTALEAVSASAKPEDLFIFYYAGHGVVAENQTFYLVPHDVTQLYGNDGGLAQKGISAAELRDFSTQIKAQKQVFILDACQSSGALQAFTSRGAAEEKAIAQLARSTGTHWLTAAGSEQFASEFTQIGHGVFTYVLLEGLQGAADRNGDQKITIKEMDAYLQDQVPVLTEKYKGTPQYPSSYGFGQDFPVGVKR
jgi:WD40 repeat protein